MTSCQNQGRRHWGQGGPDLSTSLMDQFCNSSKSDEKMFRMGEGLRLRSKDQKAHVTIFTRAVCCGFSIVFRKLSR